MSTDEVDTLLAAASPWPWEADQPPGDVAWFAYDADGQPVCEVLRGEEVARLLAIAPEVLAIASEATKALEAQIRLDEHLRACDWCHWLEDCCWTADGLVAEVEAHRGKALGGWKKLRGELR